MQRDRHFDLDHRNIDASDLGQQQPRSFRTQEDMARGRALEADPTIGVEDVPYLGRSWVVVPHNAAVEEVAEVAPYDHWADKTGQGPHRPPCMGQIPVA